MNFFNLFFVLLIVHMSTVLHIEAQEERVT
jgi:hypothetical protein